MNTRGAAQLREEFDLAFAGARHAHGATDDFLAIRLGREPYALRLSEVTMLAALPPVTALPGACHGLLGITGIRGTMLPVYDLAVLLGGRDDAAPGWLVVAAAAPVGLAFDRLEAHERVDRSAWSGDAAASSRHTAGTLRAGDGIVRPVLALASLVGTIRAGAAAHRMQPPIPP